jgi:hypothetical protein
VLRLHINHAIIAAIIVYPGNTANKRTQKLSAPLSEAASMSKFETALLQLVSLS